MTAAHGKTLLGICAATIAVVLELPLAGAADATGAGASGGPDSGLKWTPHRASSRPLESPTPPVDKTPAPESATALQSVSPPPASVSLPDGVPPATPPRTTRQPAAMVVARPPAARRPARPTLPGTMAGLPNPLAGIYAPDDPDSVFGLKVMRTPRGPSGRPILAPEGRQAVAMRATADRQNLGNDRLGGGLAPRFTPAGNAPNGRPERLAMNVDGIPSVMRQPARGNAPTGAADADRLPPADRAGAPADSPSDGPAGMDAETIGPGIELSGPDEYGPVYGGPIEYGPAAGPVMMEGGEGGLLMGEYPTQLHVESFYDDPYACEDEDCLLPIFQHHGRICAWLRRFGRPYYGWRWYRDFSASAGITGFTNATDFGLNGNFGTNEYLNWAMPFWNAFGVGWQIGWRGVQSNFQPATLEIGTRSFTKNARDQQFLTTGFFTRAFQGRGLQGGIVYDYLHDSWFENTDLAQLRYELSYVWGYHEWGFWGASNTTDQLGLFGDRRQRPLGVADTLSLYNAFYRLQFGDANEWKVWVGGTSEADGMIGTLVRAPMHKSLALEGTFTYVIPGRNQVIDLDRGGEVTSFSPAAWNVSVNVVWYPAGRSRRGLASPYRPLFEVADNGSMIRSIESLLP